MNEKFHIQLKKFELQALNFIKKEDYNGNELEIEPDYKVFIEKKEAATKEAFIYITIENEYFDLKTVVKAYFIDEEQSNIDNQKLSKIILSLILPLARPIIYQTLLQSNIQGIILPTLDIQRHIKSDD